MPDGPAPAGPSALAAAGQWAQPLAMDDGPLVATLVGLAIALAIVAGGLAARILARAAADRAGAGRMER